MDYHEWAPRSAEPPDLQGRRSISDSDRQPPYDPRDGAGRTADRIDDVDDLSGPITGSGHAVAGDNTIGRRGGGAGAAGQGVAAPTDGTGRGYWDERYSNRDPSGRGGGYPTDGRSIPGTRQPEDGQTSTSWRTDSVGTEAPARSTSGSVSGSPATHPAPGTFDDDRDYVAALSWTAIWYAVPVVLYAVWAVLQSGAPKAICARGPDCTSARSDALNAMLHNAVAVLFAVALSLAVAAWIRRVSLSWRAISLGFAAAVIGAGVATLIVSAI